jgi:hypothetical protein
MKHHASRLFCYGAFDGLLLAAAALALCSVALLLHAQHVIINDVHGQLADTL